MEADAEAALRARTDLKQYASNARILFALEMRFDVDDIYSVATNSVTDGYDDKKCDLLFVDRDNGVAVIAQGYEAQKSRKAAKANKASDLNTAVSWILGRDVSELPQILQSAAQELQSALDVGDVTKIHVWYVHNLAESDNVGVELKTVHSTTTKLLKNVKAWRKVDVEVVEVGKEKLGEWYSTRNSTIKVDGPIEVPVRQGYEIQAPDTSWSAFVTVVPLRWLHELFHQHRELLFSANIRNYLGRSGNDINSGIKKTASGEPDKFWAYNNGLTILVREFEYAEANRSLVVNGMSIVNGAQTTGAIGNLDNAPAESAWVQARFIATINRDLIRGIIKYNNSQNKVKSSDFRSDDSVQRRLRSEFETGYPEINYLGGRRGGDSDAKARPRDSLASDTVAQALTAFRGHPDLAYSRKGRIWEDNKYYDDIFNEKTTAAHILLVFSLLRSIEKLKGELQQLGHNRTTLQEDAHQFFAHRGSTYLLLSAISACKDELVNKKVVDTFDLTFNRRVVKIDKAISAWDPVVTLAISAIATLGHAADKHLREDAVADGVKAFLGFFSALRNASPKVFSDFAKHVSSKT